MKLPTEGARWFVHLRWVACILVFLATWLAWMLDVIVHPLPLILVAAGMLLCNALFWLYQRANWPGQAMSIGIFRCRSCATSSP
jgi:hypothetical protein